MTVKELLSRIDSAELSEWAAYDSIIQSEEWIQTGLICSVLANCHSSGKKRFTPEDFMPVKSKRDLLADALPNSGLKGAMRLYKQRPITRQESTSPR